MDDCKIEDTFVACHGVPLYIWYTERKRQVNAK